MSQPTESAAPEPESTIAAMPALGLRDLIRYLYARGSVNYQVPPTLRPDQLTGDVENTLVQITLEQAGAELGMTSFELSTAAARWCGENPAPHIILPTDPPFITSVEEAEILFGKGSEIAGAFVAALESGRARPADDLHPARLEVAANLRSIAAGVVGLGSAVGFARRWALRHGVARVTQALELAVNRIGDLAEVAIERVVVAPIVDVTMQLAARADRSPAPLDARREAVLAGAYGTKKGDVPPVVRLG